MLRYFFSNEVTTPVDSLIDEVLEDMHTKGVDSSDYPALMDKLERLYELKAKDRRQPVSRDTIVIVLGNFAIAALIVVYEQKHVMTSKGLGQLLHLRTDKIG